MMVQIATLVVLGLSLLIFLIIFQKSGKAVTLTRIESHFPDLSAIRRVEQTANFFGLKSRSRSQVRGNGVLVLTAEELWFSRFVPRMDISIPLNQIQDVGLVKSHMGKRVFGSRLLYVEFQTPEGIDAVAWFVAEPEEWQSAIASTARRK